MKNEQILNFEKKVFSQNGEDGIIQFILSCIGTENKFYVEFGVQDGTECNTRYLREACGFSGLMMDGGFENKSIGLYKEFITAENINSLFKKYDVPDKFDLLSIDIDYNDLWVWKAIDLQYKPNIVVIEYNSTFPPPLSVTVPYKHDGVWDQTSYFGASISALNYIAQEKGYSLVYCDKRGVNAFFILDDLLLKMPNIKKLTPEEAYSVAKYGNCLYRICEKDIMGHRYFDENQKKMIEYPSGKPIKIF